MVLSLWQCYEGCYEADLNFSAQCGGWGVHSIECSQEVVSGVHSVSCVRAPADQLDAVLYRH